MHDGEDTPPQPTASGTLDAAGSTHEIRNFARPPNLVGPGISGSLHPPSQSSNTFQRATSGSSDIGERQGRLEAIVEGFRAGDSSGVDTVAEILQELESGPWLSSEEKDATFKLYYTEISQAESHPRGEVNEPSRGATTRNTGSRKEHKRNCGDDSESESEGEDN